MIDLSVNIHGLPLVNPVMPASGTFAAGLADLIDFNRLGAFVTKTITLHPRSGNPLPRVCELDSAMLNAIGIPSKGVDDFIAQVIPFYQRFTPPLIVSISAPTAHEFAELASRLSEVEAVVAIEANISCPNIEADGRAFAVEPVATARVIKALRQATRLPLWAKLTPNTADVAAVAQAVEHEGGDAVVVGNTLLGMSIDIDQRCPRLGNIMGGLSGPALLPIMLRMVYQCYKRIAIPIIGCGGIATTEDAIAYLLAGASAIQVGTATFIQPHTMPTILDGLQAYCEQHGIQRIAALTGALNDTPLADAHGRF